MTGAYVLVCDLGGTRLRVAVEASDGSLQAKQVVPTPKDAPGALARTTRDVLDRNGGGVVGAVVRVPGPKDYDRGEL